MRVLIVDDVKQNSDLLSSALEDLCDQGVFVSARATEGIETAIRVQPDLIFMDLLLPDFNGCKATKILRANSATSHIPVVAVSAHAMRKHEQEAIDAGCDIFVSKPISIAAVRDIVKNYNLKKNIVAQAVEF